MTPDETLNLLRLLLDDALLRYAGQAESIKMLHEAQMAVLRAAYRKNDERALRPLYVRTGFLASGSAISDILYPRACRLFVDDSAPEPSSVTASYVAHENFVNYDYPGWTPATGGPAQAAHFTLIGDALHFTQASPEQRARLWYVRRPLAFSLSQSLELPPEYHPAVVYKAAALLNALDIKESERGLPQPPERTPPLEQLL